jgi:hypothetical protein
LLLAATLAGCAPTNVQQGTEVIAEGPDWRVEVVPGPTLSWEVGTGGGVVMDFRGQRRLRDATTLLVPAGAGHHTVVAGPVVDEAEKVTVTATDGTEHAADLVVANGWRWYVVRVPQGGGMLGLEAFDADGEVIDDAQVRIASDAP